MRRGTQLAIEFGAWLRDRREEAGLSMRTVGAAIEAPASTISQIEKGQRAFKNESWIAPCAMALGMRVRVFRAVWDKYNAIPVGPVVRRRGQSLPIGGLEALISDLTGPERTRVQGYIEAIIES